MKLTFQRFAVAGAVCLGLAASAAAAQDRPAGPGGAPGAHAPGDRGPGQRGPRGADREKRFADMKQRREQRLHDLLQIKPDQEGAFHTFLTSLDQARPQRGQRPDGARKPGERGPEGRGPGAQPQPKLTTPERLDRMNQRMAERTAERQQRLQKTTAAVKAFYAVLSPEQRKAFDELQVIKIGDRHHGGRRGGHWGGHMMRGPFQGPPPAPVR
jgi:periplasmic protein CpxP/Spy